MKKKSMQVVLRHPKSQEMKKKEFNKLSSLYCTSIYSQMTTAFLFFNWREARFFCSFLSSFLFCSVPVALQAHNVSFFDLVFHERTECCRFHSPSQWEQQVCVVFSFFLLFQAWDPQKEMNFKFLFLYI